MKTNGLKIMAAALLVAACWIGVFNFMTRIEQSHPAAPSHQDSAFRNQLYRFTLESSCLSERRALAWELTGADNAGVSYGGYTGAEEDEYWHTVLLTWETTHHLSDRQRAEFNAVIYRRAVHDANAELRRQTAYFRMPTLGKPVAIVHEPGETIEYYHGAKIKWSHTIISPLVGNGYY